MNDFATYILDEKELSQKMVIAYYLSKKTGIFFDKSINGIDSVIGIEYMAQTIGCYAYLRKQLEGEYHSDKIRDIISEIEDIKEKYVKTEEEKTSGRNR